MTVRTPFMQSRTKARSVMVPVRSVKAEEAMSMPRASCEVARSVRIRASPRCPALPVIRMVMAARLSPGAWTVHA